MSLLDELENQLPSLTPAEKAQLGNAGRSVPDDDVLQPAIGMARAVLTHNRRDFIGLHGLRPKHCGIVICTVDKDFVGLARRIHEKLVEIGTIDGELIRINRPRT